MTPTILFKLLSDETRLRIIYLLSREELCVCELCGILNLAQPKVSKTLSKLRDLGMVNDQRKEKFVFYKLNETNQLLSVIIEYLERHHDDYPQLRIDQQRIENKETYLDACSLKSLQDLSTNKGGNL